MTNRTRRLCLIAVVALVLGSPPVLAKEGPLVKKMAQTYGSKGEAAAKVFAQTWNLKLRDGPHGAMVGVILEVSLDQRSAAIAVPFLDALGAKVDAVSESYVRVLVPFAALSEIAAYPGLIQVRAPIPAKELDTGFGALLSESVELTGADTLQGAGITGLGVKVAVVDLGFMGLSDAIAAGELPFDVVRVKGNVEGADIEIDTEHGVGVAEHVLDMAPAVQLYCICVEDEVDLENAALYIAENGIHIANHSVGWVNSSYYDDTGPISTVINNSRDQDGVFWAVAAGNDAECHWRGTWDDPDGDNLLDFVAGDELMELTLAYDSVGYIFLNWNQYGNSVTDLDLYVRDNSNNLVAGSENWQTGTEDPAESVSFNYNTNQAPYSLEIRWYAGPTAGLDMTMFSFYHDLEYAVASSSLMEPAEAHGACSAGAVYFADWNLPDPPPESFSSQGPTNDGRLKPDIAAPDGTTCFTYGAEASYGTSFSSPTVAGAAALLLEQDPTLTAVELASSLTQLAQDIGEPGPDFVFGAGKLHLEPAGCTGDSDCDDGLPCNGTETCELQSGACLTGTAVDCSHLDDACNAGQCSPATGLCQAVAANEGTACDDGLYCNGQGTCSVGICVDGPAMDCDDGLPCTLDACDEVADQCTNSPDDGLCDDGLFCNGSETCDVVLGCVAGTTVGCDDGIVCTVDSCDEVTDQCVYTPDGGLCDDGLPCNGVETCQGGCLPGTPVDCSHLDDACNTGACDAASGLCQAQPVAHGTPCVDALYCNGEETCSGGTCQAGPVVDCADGLPCTMDACDEVADQCVNSPDNGACDDGLFCNGSEICDATVDCIAGAVPCLGMGCAEEGDQCVAGQAPYLLTGMVVSGNDWVEVPLSWTYQSMVVVTAPNYSNAILPGIVRVRNATGDSFEFRVEAALASPSVLAGVSVHYMVVEEGVYTEAEHGVKMEAVKYLSTVTDNKSSWNGESRSYAQTYAAPVVLGQVMSSNDPDWSAFWCRSGSSRTKPPDSTLRAGKTVAEDPDTARADETIGYVVIESGAGVMGTADGVLGYAAALGADTVRGATDAPPYNYSIAGLASASTAIVTLAAMDGGNGGWAILYGSDPVSPTSLGLAIDEDQAKDAERRHTTEQVGYIVFEEPPSCSSDAECDDGLLCNGVETCQGGCQPGTPVDCSHLDDACNTGACDAASGLCQAQPVADGTPCTDALFCNGEETCTAGACQAGAAVNCNDELPCTLDACDEVADQCANSPDDGLCDDGLFCNGPETCDAVAGCVAGAAADCDDGISCTVDACDEAGDQCTYTPDDGSCDDGQYCNGLESCDYALGCLAGAEPCPGMGCAEATDQCVDGQAPFLHRGVAVSSADWVSVALPRTYQSMVVVTTPNYSGASLPGLVRVRNVAGSSFEFRVESALASPSVLTGISVHYMVVEEGVYTEAEHGVKMEAVKYLSTVTDNKSAWNGESRSYAQTYSAPVVLGQVMTSNDPDWSVFWCRSGTSKSNPPDSTLRVGKTVAEDPDQPRADEVVGYIVIESGVGTVGTADGILAYSAGLGADSILGVSNSPPYAYSISGLSSASAAIVTQAAMDGGNGGWAILYGTDPVSATSLKLAVDEDQAKDTERKHISEQFGYIVFE